MKARPIEEVLFCTGESIPIRYPTTENTAKPAKKLRPELVKAMRKESPMMGLLIGL